MECNLNTFFDYLHSAITFVNEELKELHTRILTINISKLLKNPNENFDICLFNVNNISTYSYFMDVEKKDFLILMFNELYDDGHYGYAIRAYIELQKFGEYSDMFDRFYIKIIDENGIDNRLSDVMNYDGDSNVEFLKNLIKFNEYLSSKVISNYLGL
jgi:hypothetical protein